MEPHWEPECLQAHPQGERRLEGPTGALSANKHHLNDRSTTAHPQGSGCTARGAAPGGEPGEGGGTPKGPVLGDPSDNMLDRLGSGCKLEGATPGT